jgi:pyruvate/2-oxoglutarate dehydrogenase complex dihydrolipoamide dehydrogenase (E3) component
MMQQITTDICIIGAGSGGLSVAAGAAQMGARVVLFEANQMGGDCLNSGCVPSKALLAAAKAAHQTAGNPAMGVTGAPPIVDFAAVKTHVAETIATIAPHDSVERYINLGVTVITERARFVAPRRVRSDTVDVTAKFFVIATGSTAMVPPIPGLDSVPFHTNETIFSDPEKPDHLAIIGGGPIGIEMAQAHRRLGCRVTVVEAATALGKDDPDIRSLLVARLREEGIEIIEGTGVTAVGGTAGALTLTLEDGRRIAASHLLVAAGRRPAIDGLGLESAGIATGRNGIVTDQRLRTNNKRVFAIGDVTGRPQFTHIAGYHAGIVIRNMLFRLPARINETITPWVTYTDPELAHVGLTEAAAATAWGAANIRTQSVSLADNDRAVAERRTEGMIKIVTHRNGRILGATILAPQAGEMILAWSLAIGTRRKIASMAGVIAPYPTFGEAGKRAAGQFFTETLFSRRTRAIVRLLMKL